MEFKIRKAKLSDAQAIAALHVLNIDQGFLSTLGPKFLTLLYETIIQSEHSFCLVASNNETLGFIAGTRNVGTLYKEFLRTKFFRAMLYAAPKMLKPSVARKIFETLFHVSRKNESEKIPSAELLSMAVTPAARGTNVASQLGLEFRYAMAELNEIEFKVLVGGQLGAANNFYQAKMGCELALTTEVHKGDSTSVYIGRSLPGNGAV